MEETVNGLPGKTSSFDNWGFFFGDRSSTLRSTGICTHTHTHTHTNLIFLVGECKGTQGSQFAIRHSPPTQLRTFLIVITGAL